MTVPYPYQDPYLIAEDPYYLTTSTGGRVLIKEIIKVTGKRIKHPTAQGAVVLGEVVEGTVSNFEDISFTRGKEGLFRDKIGRIEMDKQKVNDAKEGDGIGILLITHNIKEVKRLAPHAPCHKF